MFFNLLGMANGGETCYCAIDKLRDHIICNKQRKYRPPDTFNLLKIYTNSSYEQGIFNILRETI